MPLTFSLPWICLLLVVSAWWPRGRDLHEKRGRMTMIAVLSGVLLASFMPNYWLGTYTLVFIFGLFRVPSPSDRLPLTVYPTLLFAALYAILGPLVNRDWLLPVLWAMVACGLILFAWWLVTLTNRGGSSWTATGWGLTLSHHSLNYGSYDYLLTYRGTTLLHLYEHQPSANEIPLFSIGQGNMNFAQGLAGGAAAAAMGLILLGSRWAWLAFALVSLPLVKIKGRWWEWGQFSQGWLYLGIILSAALIVLVGPWLILPMLVVILGAAWLVWTRYPHWLSGRPIMWRYGWEVWKSLSWKGKLMGAGPESWIHIFQRDCENRSERIAGHTAFATHSHNEFLNALVETGVLGMGCMVGYLGTTMWALLQHGPPGGAVFVLGVFLTTCATISFPWSLYHEVAFLDRGDVTGHGMPPLNTISLATVLLAEGVLR